MSAIAKPIIYPTSDGKPMAENTQQWRWIVTIVGGLRARFAGDLLWYPVEGRPDIRVAPDGPVAVGRPRGERGAYLQWEEGGIAPQVVFEILSPGNSRAEMARKFQFYQRYGVEEYYLYDPDDNTLAAGSAAAPSSRRSPPSTAGSARASASPSPSAPMSSNCATPTAAASSATRISLPRAKRPASWPSRSASAPSASPPACAPSASTPTAIRRRRSSESPKGPGSRERAENPGPLWLAGA